MAVRKLPYLNHDGIAFHYFDQGEGLPFVFLHGLGGSLKQTAELLPRSSGIRFLSIDFRGHGDTPLGVKRKIRFRVFARDVIALMDHLNIGKAVIGGISMGSAVALNIARRFPERVSGLIISRPAWLDGSMPTENRQMYLYVAKLLAECGAKWGKEVFEQSGVYQQLAAAYPAAARSILGCFEHEFAKNTFVKYLYLPADIPNPSPETWSSQTRVPTLILANRQDPVHAYAYGEYYSNYLPHAELKEITSKSVSEERYKSDTQKHVEVFLYRQLQDFSSRLNQMNPNKESKED
ncbi:alpha/beta fold hydrolase [Cohnella nanjingensis]|nr:alpha/beta hydrolase [Cohnella nanjingensis]